MFRQIHNWFLKPYPLIQSKIHKLKLIAGVGFFIFAFLIAFQPFSFDNLTGNKILFAFYYALVTIALMSVILFLFPIIFKKFFDPSRWVVFKMLLLILSFILTISLGNWYLTKTVIDQEGVNHSLLFFLTATSMVGLFPSILYIYISERIAYNQHNVVASSVSNFKKSKLTHANDNLKIRIQGNNKNESLSINIENLIYISSEKNYASVFYYNDKEIKERLLRTSLTKIESQLASFPQIIRCHKSYIVNTIFVNEIKGNARGYFLEIEPIDLLIPVSRNFPKELLFTLVQ